MITVNSLNSGHCRDLELVSLLARVQNKREFSSIKRLYFVFARDLAAVGVSIIVRCPQGVSWLY